jgi:hypothetical protein
MHTNPQLYKQLSNIKKLSITKSEYNELPKELKSMYVFLPGKGYSYTDFTNENGHRIPKEALNVIDGNYKITADDLSILPSQISTLEKEEFDFDDTKDYKLLPPAFDRYKGNIGEAIAYDYLSDFNFGELSDNDFEKMDAFIEMENYILAIDPKLYKKMGYEYDQYDDYEDYFYQKCKDVSKSHNEKPILGLVINTAYNNECLNDSVSELRCLKNDDKVWITTIPNIYKKQNEHVSYSDSIKKKIVDRIGEFVRRIK